MVPGGTPAGRGARTRLLLAWSLVVASLVSVVGMSSTQPAEAVAPTGCSYGTGGVSASSICWLDLSSFNPFVANTAAGQNMALSLPGGYTVSFNVATTGQGTTALQVRAAPWGSAVFGTPGIYAGTSGKVDIGRNLAGQTNVYIRNIVVRDRLGLAVTGYALVAADGESTDDREALVFASDKPIELVARYNGGGCAYSIVGLGTTSVTCRGGPYPYWYGTAVFRSIGATILGVGLIDQGHVGTEVAAFGVQTATLTLNKSVSSRVNASDVYDTAVISPQGTTMGTASTGTASSSTTDPVTVMPAAAGESFTLQETAASGNLAQYDHSWSCTNSTTGSTTVLPSGTGTSVQISPQVGDAITCTVTNAVRQPTLSLTKALDNGRDEPGDQFDVQIRTGSPTGPVVSSPANSTTAGSGGTVTAGTGTTGVYAATRDTEYFLTEASANGTDLSDYGTTISCADANGIQTGLPVDAPFQASLAITPVAGADISCTLTNTQLEGAMTLAKRASTVIDVNGNGVTDAGDQIDYEFDLTNTGDLLVTNLDVDDPLVGPVTCPSQVAVGATVTCTGDDPYTITQADLDAGEVQNTASATGEEPDGEAVTTPPASATTDLEQSPSIALIKTADRDNLEAGDTVTYTMTAANTGNVTLSDVSIAESAFTGTGSISAFSCTPAQPTSLAPGAELVCTATYEVTTADEDAGTLRNTARVTATAPDGTVLTDDDDARVPPVAEISLDKRVASITDINGNGVTDVGDEIHYEFDLINTGDLLVTNLQVSDPLVGSVTCPAQVPETETVVCTADNAYTITQADLDVGFVLNTATASGDDPDGQEVHAPPDTVTTDLDQSPGLSLDKRVSSVVDVNGNGRTDAGDEINYEFELTNTGNVTLTNVSVSDPMLARVGITVNCPQTRLALDESMVCTTDRGYVVTRADAEAGAVTNTATGTADSLAGVPVTSRSRDTVTTVIRGAEGTGGGSGDNSGGDNDDPDQLPNTGAGLGLGGAGLLGALLVALGGVLMGRQHRG